MDKEQTDKEWNALKKAHPKTFFVFRLGCFAFIALGGLMLFHAFYVGIPSQYGHVTVRRTISKYMIEHDRRQPKSWEDIEPYSPDVGIDLGGYQTQKHCHVAWHVDFTAAVLA